MKYSLLVLQFVLLCLMVDTSYLGYPRINFFGYYRADVNTRNNIQCNYLLNHSLVDDFNEDWGFNGTNEFELLDNVVTSVVFQNGSQSMDDPVVGKPIVGNLKRPYAKITDLDVDYQETSTIYGMKFGITGDASAPEENLQFFGKWKPSIVAQNFFKRMVCYSKVNNQDQLFQPSLAYGVSSTTMIEDIKWYDLENSTALTQLKAASDADGGRLHVRIALHHHTRNLPSSVAKNASLGYVVGSISIPSKSDTLNVPGQRLMVDAGNAPLDIESSFKEGDLCHKQNLSDVTWTGKTPFEIDNVLKEVRVDLSNSLPVDFYNSLLNLGNLMLGIYLSTEPKSCVRLIGTENIPYLSENWLQLYSGIYTVSISEDEVQLLTNSSLVLVQVTKSGSIGSTSVCNSACASGDASFFQYPFEMQSVMGSAVYIPCTVHILLEEIPYFIRPVDFYLDRLSFGDISTKTFYVTHFGRPASNITVRLGLKNVNVLPLDGVKPDNDTKPTNSSGHVSFNFSISGLIPFPRTYSNVWQCPNGNTTSLPIDGQIYVFNYSICPPDCEQPSPADDFEICLFMKAYSTVSYTKPYNWVSDVQPIFAQFAKVAPIMKSILDLGDYHDVTQLHNKQLLNYSMRLDFEDPGYMPATRDLSPVKKAMILEWLSSTQYDSENIYALPKTCESCSCPITQIDKPYEPEYDPKRCQTVLRFNKHPLLSKSFFKSISDPKNIIVQARMKMSSINTKRPLFRLEKATTDEQMQICNLTTLKRQLQTAITLEFATIPVYLTSLYSIVDGCNQKQYKIIRSVVMQEMLHMVQAANTLIAIGGNPKIDGPEYVPHFPTHLPGNVLPGLLINLEKLSLKHVYEILMGLEVPEFCSSDLTIGAFYKEIQKCINLLAEDDIFYPDTASTQVRWPWAPSSELGDVTIVTDYQTAQEGIDMIISQGEGTDILNPNDIQNKSLAHFYKFEEIVCQNELIQINETHYAYAGSPIPFDTSGVWNMRNNPTSASIAKNTNCYVEARAFHGVFRSLLRILEETFNGSPEKIETAIEIMESLQVHAKKTMWTKYLPNSIETCGPVWDYDWIDLCNHE